MKTAKARERAHGQVAGAAPTSARELKLLANGESSRARSWTGSRSHTVYEAQRLGVLHVFLAKRAQWHVVF